MKCYDEFMVGIRARSGRRMWMAGVFLLLQVFFSSGFVVAEEEDSTSPLQIELKMYGENLEIRLGLNEGLPAAFRDTLPSGAVLTVVYPLKLRRHRWMIWDGNLWKGELTARVAFDPIIGRYRCELMLDEIVVTSEERETPEEAILWLTHPPAFRVVVSGLSDPERVYFRARAVFSTSMTLLVFPDRTGTDWVSVPLENPGEKQPASGTD